jgi:hypothetical protein
VVLEPRGRRGRPKSGDLAGGLGRGSAGKDLGVAYDRLVVLVGVGMPPTRGAPRRVWFWPLRQGGIGEGAAWVTKAWLRGFKVS